MSPLDFVSRALLTSMQIEKMGHMLSMETA